MCVERVGRGGRARVFICVLNMCGGVCCGGVRNNNTSYLLTTFLMLFGSCVYVRARESDCLMCV